MRKSLCLIFLVVIIVGCSNRNYIRTPMQKLTYTVGQNASMPVGSIMVSRETWLKLCWEYWAGLINGGYRPRCDEDIDRFKEELVYAGRAGNILRIAYKEYKGNESFYMARPAFFQEVTYDLGSSDIIVFRNFRIKVLNANNEKIVFTVVDDK